MAKTSPLADLASPKTKSDEELKTEKKVIKESLDGEPETLEGDEREFYLKALEVGFFTVLQRVGDPGGVRNSQAYVRSLIRGCYDFADMVVDERRMMLKE